MTEATEDAAMDRSYDIAREDAEAGSVDRSGGGRSKRPITFLTLEELRALKRPPPLIKDVINSNELVVLYGHPGCGKTFVATDMALRIAASLDWWDHAVHPGAVVYLAGEGAFGLVNRCEAWRIDHPEVFELATSRFRLLPYAVLFMRDDEFEALRHALAELSPKPAAVVIDTLSRHLAGGDENTPRDMGLFVLRCDQIREATGAAVIVLHHKGKDKRAERGSSVLRGAADVMLDVEKDGWSVEVRGDKSKDGTPLELLRLRLSERAIGIDEDGDQITSLVLERGGEGAHPPHRGDEEAHSEMIRAALATVLGGTASGSKLLDASGVKKTSFYKALRREVEAGRIEVRKGTRYQEYALTELAPEVASSRSRSQESANSPRTEWAVSSQSEFQSAPPPFRGADANSNWDCGSRPSPEPQQPPAGMPPPSLPGAADGDAEGHG